MSGLAGRLSRLMVGLYPRRWRRRYREELLALLEEHPSSPRTVANLALGALGTHLDPGYRREGIAMSRPGSALRTTAQVAAFTVPLILVIGVLLALEVRHEQQTDGALTASYAAGVAVFPNTRLGVTAQGTGPGDSCCDLVGGSALTPSCSPISQVGRRWRSPPTARPWPLPPRRGHPVVAGQPG